MIAIRLISLFYNVNDHLICDSENKFEREFGYHRAILLLVSWHAPDTTRSAISSSSTTLSLLLLVSMSSVRRNSSFSLLRGLSEIVFLSHAHHILDDDAESCDSLLYCFLSFFFFLLHSSPSSSWVLHPFSSLLLSTYFNNLSFK